MSESEKFPYIQTKQSSSLTDLMPYIPLKLSRENKSVEVLGLLDSGASVNVLPYRIGLELGAIWEHQSTLFQLSGNLSNYESKGLILTGKVANFRPVNLAFAWTKSDTVPVILGQTNFFSLFDVCFLRSDNKIEIKIR
jgi:hypothetical protein